MTKTHPVLEELEELLQAEADALAQTDLSGLVKFSQRKLELLSLAKDISLDALPSQNRDRIIGQLKTIKQSSSDNEFQLKAISIGMRSAVERIQNLMNDVSVGAYTMSGKQLSFNRSNGTYRKAL